VKPEEQGKPEPDDPSMDERQVTVLEPENSDFPTTKVADSRCLAPLRTREVSGPRAAAREAWRWHNLRSGPRHVLLPIFWST
jgi:hypothetical protein